MCFDNLNNFYLVQIDVLNCSCTTCYNYINLNNNLIDKFYITHDNIKCRSSKNYIDMIEINNNQLIKLNSLKSLYLIKYTNKEEFLNKFKSKLSQILEQLNNYINFI